MSVSEQQIANVLVVAADSNIESLVGELVAFAGYRPLFDVTAGAAGESIRRSRPDVALIDTALPRPVVRACMGAATESGSRVVLMSSTASEAELADEAAHERALHFTLPGGPSQLRTVLDRALDRRRGTSLPRGDARNVERVAGSVRPAICAALASIARARLAMLRAEAITKDNGMLRDVGRDVLADTRRSRAALRAAVADYTKQLKSAAIGEEEAVLTVRDAISDCASVVGERAEVDAILHESERWTRDVYRAA